MKKQKTFYDHIDRSELAIFGSLAVVVVALIVGILALFGVLTMLLTLFMKWGWLIALVSALVLLGAKALIEPEFPSAVRVKAVRVLRCAGQKVRRQPCTA